MRNWILTPCIAAVAALLLFGAARADCCHRCGCQAQLKKVCWPVCEMKEVKETEYDCQCEDFCVPGRSTKHKEPDLDCEGCPTSTTVYVPTCGEVRTRKKLVKKEVVKKVPSIKWEVEYVCEECSRGSCADGDRANGSISDGSRSGSSDGGPAGGKAIPVKTMRGHGEAVEIEPPPPPPAPIDPDTARRQSRHKTAARVTSGNRRMQSYFKPPVQ